ncbi:MAG: peptidase S41 [Planctomycetes bacterium]|nr:peptidase S41 [Planctomycetota bacterium]
MIVTHPFTTDTRLIRGSEILSIKNIPTADILTKLLTIARADGSNDAKRIRYLDTTAGSRYEAFDIYFPLFFPSSSANFQITFTPPNSTASITITEKAHTYAQRQLQGASLRPTAPKDAPLWQFTTLTSDTHAPAALLTMPTWAVYNTKWDWESWLDDTLDSIVKAKTPHLIIDLRGNEGGNECGNLIISRLITKDLTIPNTQRFVRYQKTPEDLNPYLNTWDESFRNWGRKAKSIPTPSFVASGSQPFFELSRFGDNPNGTEVSPSRKRYTGKVFVLVDATCSSATFNFASLIQRNKLATIVGEPTGGNQRGINGGAFFFLRLPHSKIEVDLPLIAAFPEDPNTPDAGLTPDLLIPTTAADIASGNDSVLQAVKRLLTK